MNINSIYCLKFCCFVFFRNLFLIFMAVLVSLKSICKSIPTYNGNLTILNNINLEILSGTFTYIIGQSGSGKTTLLQIIGLLDTQTSGQLIWKGEELKYNDYNLTEIRKNDIGFVYQFHHLLPEFTLLENLLIPQFINGISKKDSIKNAEELLKKVNLFQKKDNFSNTLSGGEKQRGAIIRALINNPKIIIADEPTGNLDQENGYIIMDLLKEYIESRNIAVLMATHNTELISSYNNVYQLSDKILKKLPPK